MTDAQGAQAGVAVSGPDGEYEVPELPPGEYTVVTQLYQPAAKQVELRTGHAATVDLELVPSLRGTETPGAIVAS